MLKIVPRVVAVVLVLSVLLAFTVFISEPRPTSAMSTSSWTIKQMTKNDVEDTLGNWQSISLDGCRIVFDRRPPPIWGPEGYGVFWDIFTMNIADEPGQETDDNCIRRRRRSGNKL